MNDLEAQIAAARSALGRRWDVEHERAVERSLKRRLHHRRAVRSVATACAVTIVVGAVAGAWLSRLSGERGPTPITFADGSTATPLDATTALAVVERTPDRVTMALGRGAARFRVAPNRGRTFRVVAGDVTVEVVGTRFEVAHTPEAGVEVSVAEGRVRVLAFGAVQELAAGERRGFTAPPPSAPTLEAQPPPETPAPTHEVQRAQADEPIPTHERKLQHPKSPSAAVAKLWEQADQARMARHPAAAVTPLSRIVREHARDPSAALASFALARILLEDMHKPREAARAFANVPKLDPGTDLAEDALAHEIEAWQSAGDRDLALERARSYLERYPRGNRAPAMRRLVNEE